MNTIERMKELSYVPISKENKMTYVYVGKEEDVPTKVIFFTNEPNALIIKDDQGEIIDSSTLALLALKDKDVRVNTSLENFQIKLSIELIKAINDDIMDRL